MRAKSLQLCPTLRPLGLYSTRLPVHGIFPGKNTGVGCHFLLQGIFPTQASDWRLLSLPHGRQILDLSLNITPFFLGELALPLCGFL